MYIYIYIYIYICVCVCIYIYIYIYIIKSLSAIAFKRHCRIANIRISTYICNITCLGLHSYTNAFDIPQLMYVAYSKSLHLILLKCQ